MAAREQFAMRMIKGLCTIAKRHTAQPAQGWVACVFCHYVMQSSSRRQAITGMALYPVLRRFSEQSSLSHDGGECKGGDEVDYPLAQLRSTTRPRGRAAQPRPTGDGHEIALGPHVVLRQLERRPSNSLRSTSSGRGNGATPPLRPFSFF